MTTFPGPRAGEYTVADEEGFARTYDEDEIVTIRKGDLRAVMDVGTMSMDFASGFLDNEQVEALRKCAEILGIDPIVVTPSNFACQYNGKHQWRRYPRPANAHALGEFVLRFGEGAGDPLECTLCGLKGATGQYPGLVVDE